MDLSKNIQKYCKAKGWTLARLARESEVPHQTIHNWVVGRNAVKLNQLKNVAEALGVSVYELCWGVSDPYHKPGDELLEELFTGDLRVTIHRIKRIKSIREGRYVD